MSECRNASMFYSSKSMYRTCLYMVVNTSGYTHLGSVVAVAVSRLLCLSNNLKWDRFGAGLVAAVPRMSFPFSLFLVIPQVVFGHILEDSDRSSRRPTNVSSRLPYGCCPLLALWLYWNLAMTNGCRFCWPSCTHVFV